MSGKSKEEIAFELVSKLKGVGVWGENNMVSILDMYSECLEATSGLRSVDGKVPPALKLAQQAAAPAKAAPAPTAAPAATQAPVMRQAAPAPQAAPPQPVIQQPQVRQPQQLVQPVLQQQR